MWKYLLAGLVAAVGVAQVAAGIRKNDHQVNALEINGASYGSGVAVGAPTLHFPSGYLSYDVTGNSPDVSFDLKKGPHTTWAFVEMRGFTESSGGAGGGYEHEREGYTMKLRATEGPFAGWYLGRVDGKLVLVEEPRRAATLRLVLREADVLHK
jgi:hypothetical protein